MQIFPEAGPFVDRGLGVSEHHDHTDGLRRAARGQHHERGNVKWDVMVALVPTALAGGYLGAWLTTKLHADDLKRMFGGFLVLVGCRLLFFK